MFAIGGVALVGGVVLFATAPSSKPPAQTGLLHVRRVQAEAAALQGGGLVRVQGEF